MNREIKVRDDDTVNNNVYFLVGRFGGCRVLLQKASRGSYCINNDSFVGRHLPHRP